MNKKLLFYYLFVLLALATPQAYALHQQGYLENDFGSFHLHSLLNDTDNAWVDLATTYESTDRYYLLEQNRSFNDTNQAFNLQSSLYEASVKIGNWGRFGLSNAIFYLPLPALTIEEAPIYIFDQPWEIRLDGKIKIFSHFNLFHAKSWNNVLETLVEVRHHNLSYEIAALDATTETQLIFLSGFQLYNELLITMRYRIMPELAVALKPSLYQYHATNIKANLISSISAIDPVKEVPRWDQMFFSTIAGGVSYKGLIQQEVNLTLLYQRTPAAPERISLKTFTLKPVDTYSTLSTGLLYFYHPSSTITFNIAFRYLQSAIGPGNKDLGGKTGYSYWDFFISDVSPKEQYALGLEWQKAITTAVNFTFYTAVLFENIDLGIDENGENPGVYKKSSLLFPIYTRFNF